ncbi:hypothetical protein Tco_1216160 [Tanacetum coccineum]
MGCRGGGVGGSGVQGFWHGEERRKKLTHLYVNANGCPILKDVADRSRCMQENLKVIGIPLNENSPGLVGVAAAFASQREQSHNLWAHHFLCPRSLLRRERLNKQLTE